MVETLLIAAGVGIFARHCPHCGHATTQRRIEARRSHVTYWCTECSIPYDTKPGQLSPSTCPLPPHAEGEGVSG